MALPQIVAIPCLCGQEYKFGCQMQTNINDLDGGREKPRTKALEQINKACNNESDTIKLGVHFLLSLSVR